MTTKNEQSTAWFWGIMGFCALCTVVGSCTGNTTNTTYVPNQNSVEHRYATERFKQEGLSTSDAQKAADAVLKFHNAQKNR